MNSHSYIDDKSPKQTELNIVLTFCNTEKKTKKESDIHKKHFRKYSPSSFDEKSPKSIDLNIFTTFH